MKQKRSKAATVESPTPETIPNSTTDKVGLSSPSIITRYRLAIVGLAVLSVVVALVFVRLPEKFQFAMVAAVPAILVGAYVLISPFAGVWCFVMMDYFRPYTFITALRPLRLGILTVAVTLLSWVVHQAVRKEKLYWHATSSWFVGFLLIVASSVLTAANNFRAYEVLEGMLVTFAMYFLITNIVKSLELVSRIVWLMLLIHVYYALKGIYNFAFVGYVAGTMVTSGSVGSSFMADENDFAMAMNAIIPFAFFMFHSQKNRFRKLLLLAALVACALGVVSSQSRGGWVGLMAVILFCIVNSKQKIISFAAIGVLGLGVLIFAPSSYWEQIGTITDTGEATANSRIQYWKAAWGMFLDYPLTGVGAGNGPVQMPNYVTGLRDPATQWGRTFHGNLPLILAETGALGMLCYLMMIYLSFRTLFRIRRQFGDDHHSDQWTFASSIAGGMLGWLTSATFLSAAYYPHLWTFHALTISLYLGIENANKVNNPNGKGVELAIPSGKNL